MIAGWFLMLCTPGQPLVTCEVLTETATYRECVKVRRRLGNPRAQCRRLPVDTL